MPSIVDPDLYCHMASLGQNVLMGSILEKTDHVTTRLNSLAPGRSVSNVKCAILKPISWIDILNTSCETPLMQIPQEATQLISKPRPLLLTCCNRTFYCNDNKITEFDMINTKNSSTAYVVIYKLIT